MNDLTFYGNIDEYTEVYYGDMDSEGWVQVWFKTYDPRDYLHDACCMLPSRDFYEMRCLPDEVDLYRKYLDDHADDIMARAKADAIRKDPGLFRGDQTEARETSLLSGEVCENTGADANDSHFEICCLTRTGETVQGKENAAPAETYSRAAYKEEAERYYCKAMDIINEIGHSNDNALNFELIAECLTGLGELRHDEDLVGKAISVWYTLSVRFPGNDSYLDRIEETRACMQKLVHARLEKEQRIAQLQDKATYWEEAAERCRNRGRAFSARVDYESALEVWKKLLEENPEEIRYAEKIRVMKEKIDQISEAAEADKVRLEKEIAQRKEETGTKPKRPSRFGRGLLGRK